MWPMQGVLDGKKHNYEKLELVINRERWAMNRDGNTGTSACGVLEIKTPSGCCRIDIPVCENLPEVQEGTFVDTAGYIVMEAEHYADRKDGYAADGKREGKNEKVRFQCIRDYGKTRSAMKAFPVTAYGVPGRKCTVSGVSFLGIKARRVCTYALYAALQSGGERSETLLRCAE